MNTNTTTATYFPISFSSFRSTAILPGNAQLEDVTVVESSNDVDILAYFTWCIFKAGAYDTLVGDVSIRWIAVGI